MATAYIRRMLEQLASRVVLLHPASGIQCNSKTEKFLSLAAAELTIRRYRIFVY